MAGPVQLQKCAKPGVFFIIYDRDTGIPDNNLTLFFLVSEKVVDEIDKDAPWATITALPPSVSSSTRSTADRPRARQDSLLSPPVGAAAAGFISHRL